MNKIEALSAVLQDPGRSPAEKEIAARALRSVSASGIGTGIEPACASTPYQELSPDSLVMLHALGKKHLRDISEDEFARYARHFDPRFKELLCRQWREWVCPDDAFLDLIVLTRTEYWKTIRDNAKSDDVRMNARTEINNLSEADF
jgi:hypothetical protein